ncbi:hypothetical protein DMC47_36080 [Nostoc sp. 3335mG]|nr:hypothetical protein DMC47_36080 [Nostoc sp. 3335mG]
MRIWVAFVFGTALVPAGAAGAPVSKPTGAISCIDAQRIEGQSAEGEDTILFRVGPKTYRNRLASICPGLSRLNSFDSLETEPWGGQLCQGDSVQLFDPNSIGPLGANGPRCRLGWFEPVPSTKP